MFTSGNLPAGKSVGFSIASQKEADAGLSESRRIRSSTFPHDGFPHDGFPNVNVTARRGAQPAVSGD